MKALHLLVRTGVALGAAWYISSCQEPASEPAAAAATAAGQRFDTETAFPGETGIVKKGRLFGHDIVYSEINGQAVYEGDMILTKAQLGQAGARTEALIETTSRWYNNTVPYTIDPSITNPSVVMAAIADIEYYTPIRFVLRKESVLPPNTRPVYPHYVTFTVSRGYSSAIGCVGGQQFVTMPMNPTKGNLLHELGHTLGMRHEHTRPDRNIFVKIISENISEAADHLFSKSADNSYEPLPYGTFDFNSIMMLGSYAYSKNGGPTMTTVDGKLFLAQRDQLAPKDYRSVIAAYANVFAAKTDDIYVGDETTGKTTDIAGYVPDARKIVAIPGKLFTSWKSGLRGHDAYTAHGADLENNFPDIKGMTYNAGYLYVLQGGYIWKVDVNTAEKTKLGGQYWGNGTAIACYDGFLYVVAADNLFRVTMTGQYFSMGLGYKGVTELTTHKNNLYVIKPGGKLHKINPLSDTVTPHGNTIFDATAQMAATGKNLVITSNGTLYNVDENGVVKAIASGWSGITDLAAVDPANK